MKLLIFVLACIIILTVWSVGFWMCKRKLYGSNLEVTGNNHIEIDKLMIIAHPDDELIFGGRELLSESGWLVVCVTNGSNYSGNIISINSPSRRRREFTNVANRVGFRYEIWDFEDSGFNANWPDELFRSKIKNLLFRQKYKKIVTHNLDGEYGHIQHRKISRIVHDLKPNNLYTFTYVSDREMNKPLGNITINPHLEKLKEIIQEYRSQVDIVNKYWNNLLYQHIEYVKFQPTFFP